MTDVTVEQGASPEKKALSIDIRAKCGTVDVDVSALLMMSTSG